MVRRIIYMLNIWGKVRITGKSQKSSVITFSLMNPVVTVLFSASGIYHFLLLLLLIVLNPYDIAYSSLIYYDFESWIDVQLNHSSRFLSHNILRLPMFLCPELNAFFYFPQALSWKV